MKKVKTKKIQTDYPLAGSFSFQFQADSSPVLRYFIEGVKQTIKQTPVLEHSAAMQEHSATMHDLTIMLQDMLNNCKARMYFNIFITEEPLIFKDVKDHDNLFDI